MQIEIANQSTLPLLVTQPDQLLSPEFRRLLRTKRPLILNLSGLSEEGSAALTARVNDLRNECGCGLAGVCAIAAFGILFAWLLNKYGAGFSFFFRLPFAVIAAIIAGGVAKALRISLARHQANREIEALAETLCRSAPAD